MLTPEQRARLLALKAKGLFFPDARDLADTMLSQGGKMKARVEWVIYKSDLDLWVVISSEMRSALQFASYLEAIDWIESHKS